MMSDWAMQHNERVAAFERAEQRRLDARIAKARAARDGVPTVSAAAHLSEFACRVETSFKTFALAALGECERGRPFDDVVALDIAGKIDGETELRLCAQLCGNPRTERIVLRINSEGGFVPNAEAIFIALRTHPAAEKTAIVTGDCLSAALLPLAACSRRIAGSHAKFLVHKTWQSEALDADARARLRAHDLIEETAMKAAGVDPQHFAALRESECELTAEEAAEIGLVEIVDDAEIEAAQSDFSAAVIEGDFDDDAGDAGISAAYEIKTSSGEIVALPVNRSIARSVVAMMRAGERPCSAAFGLPSAYLEIALGRF